MLTPAWIPDLLAVMMLGVGLISAGRLAVAVLGGRLRADSDVDAAHLLMGVAMAGMLAVGLRTLPGAAWAVIFAAMTVWFAVRVGTQARGRGARMLGSGHHLPHLVHSAAMVYMFAAVTGAAQRPATGMVTMAAGATGMGTLRAPALGLLFILFMAARAVWDTDQLGAAQVGTAQVGTAQLRAGRLADPRIAVVCRIAMGVTMAFMLVGML